MPADVEELRGLAIERLDAARHDRAAFTCGTERIDNFLKITAAKYLAGDTGRIWVVVERDGDRLAGFYAIGPHSIDASELEPDMKKRLPNYDRIAAYYLSMIGTRSDVQGKGVGSFRLADALKRCVQASEQMGGRFVVLDTINEDAAKLYGGSDFIALPSVPGRMVLSIAKLRATEASSLEGEAHRPSLAKLNRTPIRLGDPSLRIPGSCGRRLSMTLPSDWMIKRLYSGRVGFWGLGSGRSHCFGAPDPQC